MEPVSTGPADLATRGRGPSRPEAARLVYGTKALRWLALLWALLPALGEAQVATDIRTDGALDPGGLPRSISPDSSGDFAIDETFGAWPGGPGSPNLFFQFQRFDLGAGDTARFTLTPGARATPPDRILSRVTGSEPSQLFGTLSSDVPGADLYFLNPSGILFGPESRLDVRGSFFASSADTLELSDGVSPPVRWGDGSGLLSTAPPTAFGFLGGAVGAIQVDRGNLVVPSGQTLALVGGDLTLDGGDADAFLSAPGGRLALVSVASGGDVRGLGQPGAELRLEGFGALGDIELRNDASVSASSEGFGPDLAVLCAGTASCQQDLVFSRSELVAAGLVEGGNLFVQPGSPSSPRPNDVGLIANPGLQIYQVIRARPRGEQAGRVEVRGRSLALADSEIQALNVGDQPGGSIDIALEGGDLQLRDDSEIAARSGLTLQGEPIFNPALQEEQAFDVVIGGAGGGGDIAVTARNVRLEGGSRISTTSEGSGAPGSLRVTAERSLELVGSDAQGDPSALFSNAQGIVDASGQVASAGSIVVDAENLVLVGGGSVIAQTTGDQNAGNIDITVDRLVVGDPAGDGSRIDTSTSAQSLIPPEPRDGLVPVLRFAQDPALRGPTLGRGAPSGNAGQIEITARDSIQLFGPVTFEETARIASSSLAASAGDAGEITLRTPELVLDEAALAVSTGGAGAGGAITLDVGSLQLRNGSEIRARSTASLADVPSPGVAGDVVVGPSAGEVLYPTRSVRLVDGSRIVTSAVAADGGDITVTATGTVVVAGASAIDASDTGGEGGNVRIGDRDAGAAPAAVAVVGGSSVLARAAVPGGDGGVIVIEADSLFVSPDSTIDAENEVIIRAPDTTLQSGLPRPGARFLDATRQIRARCAARRSGERSGSFVVSPGRGAPLSPEDLMLAFDLMEPGEPADDEAPLEVAQVVAAREAIRGGQLEQAASDWSEAAARFEAERDPAAESLALRGLAQTQQARGLFAESLETLRASLAAAEAAGDEAARAASLGGLGNALLAMGERERAQQALEQALADARSAAQPALVAHVSNDLANLYAFDGESEQALRAYTESAELFEQLGEASGAARAHSNAARVALEAGEVRSARRHLEAARGHAQGLPKTAAGARIWIHLGLSAARLAAADAGDRQAELLAAHGDLSRAQSVAREVGADLERSYAAGFLSALYEQEGRFDEALLLARQALRSAEAAGSGELLARWERQEGRLLWGQGRAESALDAYERAVRRLEETRQEALVRYGPRASYFRRAVAPTYLELADALLQSSERVGDPAASQALLEQARDVVELLKAAELRDYFRDECVAELEARTVSPESVAAGAAIVYPIVLPDRLELLVTLPGGLRRFSVSVGEVELREELLRFRRGLQGVTRSWRRPAERLYDWLLRPYLEPLEEQGVETLVFVPDGLLRSVPMAALYDGERFLVERFALAVTPGLELLDPQPLGRSDLRLLMAGLSEPVQGYPGLASVRNELDAVERRFGGTLLLDEDFVLERAEEEFLEARPSVVHIASHGEFTGDPNTSFLLTWDGRLTMQRLGELILSQRFRDEPLEMLVLSACETAVGDERAALGLAGLAVRAGARSALGSLWSVSDEATAALVAAFYAELEKSGTSRAQALQRAQTSLLAERRFRHPRYWASFLLISNWL